MKFILLLKYSSKLFNINRYADFLSSRGAGALPGTGLQKATQA